LDHALRYGFAVCRPQASIAGDRPIDLAIDHGSRTSPQVPPSLGGGHLGRHTANPLPHLFQMPLGNAFSDRFQEVFSS
jgi:hypothetical protein